MNQTLTIIAASMWLAGSAFAQFAAFTYQGVLANNAGAANGPHDFRFTLYDQAANGIALGGPIETNGVPVTNGLFAVRLDFGSSVFTGAARWLEIAVKDSLTNDVLTVLSPRQPITSTPYAINAANLMSLEFAPIDIKVNGQRALRLEPPALGIGISGVPNIIGGSEYNVVDPLVAGATIGGGGATNYFGSPVTNRVSANFGVIGGGASHLVSGEFGTIGGGWRNTASDTASTVAGGDQNTASGRLSTVGGGLGNTSSGGFATVSGGTENAATNWYSTVPGGYRNLAGGTFSFAAGHVAKALHDGTFVWAGIVDPEAPFSSTGTNQFLVQASGGVGVNTNDPAGVALNVAGTVRATMFEGAGSALMFNTIGNEPLELKVNGQRALRLEPTSRGEPNVIGGSTANSVTAGYAGATIGGGHDNVVVGDYATIGGGRLHSASGFASTVGGGSGNIASSDSSTVGGGSRNHAGHEGSTIAGGNENTTGGDYAFIGGGSGNYASDGFAVVGGGLSNTSSVAAFVGGGEHNSAEGWWAVVGGGHRNTVAQTALFATISGGDSNRISSITFNAAIGGGAGNVIRGPTGGATIAGGVQNQIQGEASGSTIGGGWYNLVANDGGNATIGGGRSNQIAASSATIAGGDNNAILFPGHFAAIGGGWGNQVNNHIGTIGGGGSNQVTGFAAVVGGGGGIPDEDSFRGEGNVAGGDWSSVLGGSGNIASGSGSAIAGGRSHTASGSNSIVAGGFFNTAAGEASFAAGYNARALHHGSFVWADATFRGQVTHAFDSVADNEFAVRATGGARVVSAVSPTGVPTAGVELAPGSGAWSMLSDRNAKENFSAVNPRSILDKVTSLSLATWNYKSQDTSIRHIGPTAQDFHSAFGLGENERTIATVDTDGVALAAIQGLNQKLEEQLKAKDTHIETLEQRITRLEKLITSLTPAK